MLIRSVRCMLFLVMGLTISGCHLLCDCVHGPSYSACVQPDGCISCATGVYGTHLDPVQRTREIRSRRARRRNRYRRRGLAGYASMPPEMAACPSCQQQARYHLARRGYPRRGMPRPGMYGPEMSVFPYGYGCEECYAGGWCECGWCDESFTTCPCQDEFLDGEVVYEGEVIQDGEVLYEGEVLPEGATWSVEEGEGWTEIPSGPCPHCQSKTTQKQPVERPAGKPPEPPPEPPRESPRPLVPAPIERELLPEEATEGEPSPISPTSDEYYMPRPMPTMGNIQESATSQATEQAGDPVQPLLWVPTGL